MEHNQQSKVQYHVEDANLHGVSNASGCEGPQDKPTAASEKLQQNQAVCNGEDLPPLVLLVKPVLFIIIHTFYGKDYVRLPKEMSVLDVLANTTEHWVVRPPYPLQDLSPLTRRRNILKWPSPHDLKWDSGVVELHHVHKKLAIYMKKGALILFNSLETREYLGKIHRDMVQSGCKPHYRAVSLIQCMVPHYQTLKDYGGYSAACNENRNLKTSCSLYSANILYAFIENLFASEEDATKITQGRVLQALFKHRRAVLGAAENLPGACDSDSGCDSD